MKACSLSTWGLAVVLGAGFALSSPVPVHALPSTAAAFPAPAAASLQLLEAMNGERTRQGLTPYVRTVTLDGFAQVWSDFMAGGACVPLEQRRLCQRQDLTQMANTAYPGSWTRVGENVGLVPAGGTVDSLHQAFMASRLQRANLLDPQFNAVGVGVTIAADGTLFATYEFVATLDDPSHPTVLPTPPPDMSPEDTLLFYVNDARTQAGLAPLARQAVLDREARAWSSQLAGGAACRGVTAVCHSGLMASVAKTAVGPSGWRWWSENVGMRWGVDVVSQFLGFMRSAPHRANIMRPEINLIGVGIATDPLGRAFTSLQFVAAKSPAKTLPPGGSSCGWLPSTIAQGATGPYVRTLQCALTVAGVYTGPVDGAYTVAVVAAVKTFQSQHGMRRPSGRADLATRRMLGAV